MTDEFRENPQAFIRDGFRIESWRIEPGSNRVFGPNGELRLEPKVMELLVVLAAHPGEVMGRERLLAKLWPDAHVSGHVLNSAVSKLRKIFETAREHGLIETIPKRGYRLTARVTSLESAPTRAPDRIRNARLVWVGLPVLAAVAFLWFPKADRRPENLLKSTPFTSYPGAELHPALSPDGTRVAFAWRGENGRDWDIYLKDRSNEEPVRLTRFEGFEDSPAWSPDGRTLAFQRFTLSGDCQVVLLAVDGGGERVLTSCNGSIYADLDWSSDGRWLAFSARPGEGLPPAIFVVDKDLGKRRSVSQPLRGIWGDHDPAFSPDSGYLAFTRSNSESIQDLYMVPVGGGEEIRVTTDAKGICGYDWDPEEEGLVFSSNRSGSFALWRIKAPGARPEPVRLSGVSATFPSFARKTRELAFLTGSMDLNIWRLELDGDGRGVGVPIPLARSTAWDVHPQLSRLGRIAFASNRSGGFEVWTGDGEGGNLRRLTRTEGPLTGSPRWSPDGGMLAFDSRPEGHADVFVSGGAEGDFRRLTSSTSDDLAPGWSHDSRWVYFGSNRSGDWQVWKVSAEGGAPVRVTRNGGYSGVEDPGGTFFYFTKPALPGIWRLPLGGGAEEAVLSALQPEDWGSWAVVGNGLYYISRNAASLCDIRFFDPATGTDRLVLANQPIPEGDPSLAVAADGTRLLFTRIDDFESDIASARPGD